MTALAAATLSTATASADTVAPKAFGWCDGLDPARWGDARTVRSSTTVGGATIETRYSPSAQCAWGRMRFPFSSDAELVATRNVDLKSYTKVGGGYTRALDDAGVLVQVCGNDWAGGFMTCNEPY